MDEQHIPGQAETEFAVTEPEQVTPEKEPEADTPEDEPKGEESKDKQPEPEEPKAEDPEKGKEPEDPPKTDLPKKRSIYDEYKDKKEEAKVLRSVAEQALAAAGIELTGKETIEDLQALLQKKDDAETPAEETAADDDLTAFAKRNGMDPETLKELTGIISKSLPKNEQPPEGLKPEEIAQWREDQKRAKVASEDAAIDAQGSQIREQLKGLGHEVHDDTEFAKVMARVKELSHTEKFHDKELDYIVYANRSELAKLISPKKASFEPGGHQEESDVGEVDYSKAPTPGLMQRELSKPNPSSMEIRRQQS